MSGVQQGQRQHYWRVLLFFCLLGWVGCSQSSSSGGCGGCSKPIPGGFPSQHRIKNAAQMTLTEKGVAFFEQNNQVLLKQFLPGGLSFDVPQSKSGNIEVCRNPPCKVTGKINKLDLDLVPKKTIRANLWVDINSTKIEVRVTQKVLGIKIRKTCDIQARIKNKHIKTDIILSIDPRNEQLTFDVGTPSFSLSSKDFKVSGDLICSGLDLLKGLFNGMIEKEIKKAIKDAFSDLNCMKCKQNSDCPQGATCSKEKCMQGGACLAMPLGAEGALDLGGLLGGLGNKNAKELWFAAHVGGRAEVKKSGVELGMLGGTHAESHICAPPKKFPPLPAPPLFSFPAAAPDGQPYMLALAISQVMLTKAMRDLYRSGMFCLRLDSSIAPDLGSIFTVKGIGALISPSLPTIVDDENAPIVINLRPADPPDISIGRGKIVTNAQGKKELKEPLLELAIPNLGFDFMLLLHDRWVRLFTYRVDIALPLGLEVRPGNKLGLIMGDIGNALTNPRIEQSYILKEDPQKMAKGLHNLIKAVLPMAVGQIGNQEFELPDLEGFRLTIRGITGQVPRTDKANRFQFLALFADLGLAPPTKPLLPETSLGLRLVQRRFPPRLWQSIQQQKRLSHFPSVVVAIDDHRPGREYSLRLNSGLWTPFSPQKEQTLTSPQWLLQGHHRLQVRSRLQQNPTAPDEAWGSLTLPVDYTPPRLQLKATRQGITLQSSDNLTPSWRLKAAYRINGGAWLPWSARAQLPAHLLPSQARVEVRLQDEQQNTSQASLAWQSSSLTTPPPAAANTPPSPPSAPAQGCQTGHSPPANALFLLALLLPALLLRRRP